MINNILKKPLNKFLLWFLGVLLVCFIGLSNVFALTTKTIYSGNSSGTLTGSGYYNYGYLTGGGTQASTTASVGSTISGVAYGFMFYMYEDINLQKTYTIRINFMSNDLKKEVTSSYFEIATCNANACDNGTLVSIEKSSYTNNSTWVQVKFNPINIGNSIRVTISGPNGNEALTSVSNFGISSVQIESTNANQDIINNNNNNTNNIINNNNSNTQEIIDNNNQNTQDIIDNYTSVGQSIIDNQNSIAQQQQEQQQVCQSYSIENITTNNYYLNQPGDLIPNNNYGVTDYLNINNAKIKVLTSGAGGYHCFYDIDKNLIGNCTGNSVLVANTELSIPNNAYYVRFTIYKVSNIPRFSICKNGNQALQDTLTNDNVDENNIANAFESFNNFLDDNSTITQLITLPIILYTAILNNLNGTCQPFNLGKLYGSDLILPCINISQYLGNALWSMIDIIISGFAIYAISKKMIKIFNNFSSLREGDVIDD